MFSFYSNFFQRLESLQAMLAWKPLEVIKENLQVINQWARPAKHYPMKKRIDYDYHGIIDLDYRRK